MRELAVFQSVLLALALTLTPVPTVHAAEPTEAPGVAGAPCGVLRESDDFWFCMALQDADCGLARSDEMAMQCLALNERNCGLLQQTRDFWFCESLVRGSCGLNRDSREFWMCEGLLNANCGVISRSDDFWRCEAWGEPIRRLVKDPPQPEPEPFDTFIL